MQASSTTSCRHELIAQHPLDRRDDSRLLVYSRATGEIRHRAFRDLPGELPAGTLVGRERHARRAGADPRSSGRGARCCCSSGSAARSGRGSRGRRGGCGRGGGTGRSSCSSTSARGGGGCGSTASRRARRRCRRTSPSRSATPSATRRSTRRRPGSAAAPTAGLHFTPELLARLDVERVTLHVGLDTFRPLAVERVEEHPLHGERYEVAARGVGADPRRRSACSRSGRRRCGCSRRSRAARRSPAAPSCSSRPGFEFRRVDALLTNFHLPRSTLLALVMAFAGVERDARRSTGSRSRSGTASTRSATRCSCSEVEELERQLEGWFARIRRRATRSARCMRELRGAGRAVRPDRGT